MGDKLSIITLAAAKGANGGGGGGTSDYSALSNKPKIEGVELSGNKSASDLGLASLDSNGKVPAAQLPSYVDDVVEYDDLAHFPATGEDGKIYIAKDTNKTYRWSGTAYVEISESLALGETASTAYAGNKGKANADAIDAIKDGTSIDSFGDVESALADKADVSSVKNEFIGTTAQWNALTTEQKKAYDTYQLTDDYAEGGMHHYSTEEQVVGTWIDGSTVYEKFIVLDTPLVINSNQWAEHIINLQGQWVVKIDAFNTDNYLIPIMSGFANGELEVCNIRPSQITIDKILVQYTKTT